MRKTVISFCVLFITFCSTALFAQNGLTEVYAPGFRIDSNGIPKKNNDLTKVYSTADEMPSFKGGMTAFHAYVYKKIRYPKRAKDSLVTGRVYVYFIVEPDGKISSAKIIRGIGSGCNQEALRVVRRSPKWHPGKIDGTPVRVEYAVPIDFTLN